jgi:hypothetical protein
MKIRKDITADFTDANFRRYCLYHFDKDKDGKLYPEDVKKIKILRPIRKQIASLAGIEHFSAVEHISCQNNKLTSLDLSKNTALKFLNCRENHLKALNITKNTSLKHLQCNNNQLTTLNLTKNISLKELYCFKNLFTALDVTKNTLLTELYASNNKLTTLDITKNTHLYSRSLFGLCSNNPLTELSMGKNLIKKYNKILAAMRHRGRLGCFPQDEPSAIQSIKGKDAEKWLFENKPSSRSKEKAGLPSMSVAAILAATNNKPLAAVKKRAKRPDPSDKQVVVFGQAQKQVLGRHQNGAAPSVIATSYRCPACGNAKLVARTRSFKSGAHAWKMSISCLSCKTEKKFSSVRVEFISLG